MTTTGTKEKRTKIGEHHPPREIRDMSYGKAATSARRAWLAAKEAEIKATPNRDAKIVGTGSYQYVAEYEIAQLEGRVRHRGVCQFCGGSQVVDNGVIVLHGYKRPGHGWVYGRCPAVGEKPLNVDKTITERWARDTQLAYETAEQRRDAAQAREKKALAALYSGNTDREPNAYAECPRTPNVRNSKSPTASEQIALDAYGVAIAEWAKRFPLHAEYEQAKSDNGYAATNFYGARMQRDHFARLLASGTFGSPLVEEIVT